MLLHTVLFWLRPDLTHDEIARFEAGLKELTTITTVKTAFYGKPASTRRPVIDASYSYQLVLGFDGLQGHDSYQVDPIHKNFVKTCSPLWAKVLIYDADACE
jgi:Stress responsive A/B Barrel Domain